MAESALELGVQKKEADIRANLCSKCYKGQYVSFEGEDQFLGSPILLPFFLSEQAFGNLAGFHSSLLHFTDFSAPSSTLWGPLGRTFYSIRTHSQLWLGSWEKYFWNPNLLFQILELYNHLPLAKSFKKSTRPLLLTGSQLNPHLPASLPHQQSSNVSLLPVAQSILTPQTWDPTAAITFSSGFKALPPLLAHQFIVSLSPSWTVEWC